MIDSTGERIASELLTRVRLEHLQRYAICREVVRGKRVLAIGSGEGHGGAMLSDTAAQVIGVERNPSLVAHAAGLYGRLPHLSYTVGALDRIPLADRSIDVVVAFGTLYSRDLHMVTLREIRRVMAPEGLFLFAWPNAFVPLELQPRLGLELQSGRSPTLSELGTLLKSFFEQVEFWGQRLAVGSFTFPLDRIAPRTKLRPLTVEEDVITESVAPLEHPLSYIAVCSDAPFEPHLLQLESVVLEPAEDLYLQLQQTMLENDKRHQKDDAVITQLMDRLEAARTAQKTTTRLHSVAVSELQDERLEQREMERVLSSARQEVEAAGRLLADSQATLQITQMALDGSRLEAQTQYQALKELQQQHVATQAVLQDTQATLQDTQATLQETQAALQETQAELDARIRAHETQLAERDAQIGGWQGQVEALRHQLADVYASTSWRISAPIRRARRAIDALLGRGARP
jgi:SAM-dependent methyltransferase